jgi:pimeloyl-ACP methyl ester carboxylesterase
MREYGNCGAYLVVLHGGPGAPGYMAPVARELADSFRVVEPFQRSSGLLPLSVAQHVQDLHEVVTAIGSDSPPALLGSSWGAMLALAYCAAHPDSVGPLVLVGCGTFDEVSRATMLATIQQRTDERIRRSLEQAARIDDENARLKAIVEAEMPIYAYAAREPLELEGIDARGLQQTWDDMLELQRRGVYPAAFGAIRAPVLMVHGDFDPHPGNLIRASLLAHIPQLEYVELAHCGHYPWLEQPAAAEFFTVVRTWLKYQVIRLNRGAPV